MKCNLKIGGNFGRTALVCALLSSAFYSKSTFGSETQDAFLFNSQAGFLANGGQAGFQQPSQIVNVKKPIVLNTLEMGPVRFGDNQAYFNAAGSLTFFDGGGRSIRVHFLSKEVIEKLGSSLAAWSMNPGTIRLFCAKDGILRMPQFNSIIFIVGGDATYDGKQGAPKGECRISDLGSIYPQAQ